MSSVALSVLVNVVKMLTFKAKELGGVWFLGQSIHAQTWQQCATASAVLLFLYCFGLILFDSSWFVRVFKALVSVVVGGPEFGSQASRSYETFLFSFFICAKLC